MKRKNSKRVLGTRVTVRLPTSLYRALSEKAKGCHQSISTCLRTEVLEKLNASSDVKWARKEYEVLMEIVYLLRAFVQKSEQGVLPKGKRRAKEREKGLNSPRKGGV